MSQLPPELLRKGKDPFNNMTISLTPFNLDSWQICITDMPNPTCIIEMENSAKSGLLLYLEPEGFEFEIPPGEVFQLKLFGTDSPIQIKHSVNEQGKVCVSFWPDKGSYDLWYKGKRVWDIVLGTEN